MSKQDAINLVNQFSSNNAMQGAWSRVDKTALANGLIERINDPNRIDQAATPFCGPTTIIRSLAMSNPVAYAQAAIDLYLRRSARVNNLVLTPGNELVGSAPPGRTNPADWIMLASLRDSQNWFLSPGGWFGTNLAGITIPSTIENWFRNTGYTQIVNDTSLSGGDIPIVKSMCAKEASNKFNQGYTVAMLVDSDVLDSSTQDDLFSMYPDHWIILNSTITNVGTSNYSLPVSFQAYTWGSIRSVPQLASKPLNQSDFLNKFYGYIAARL